MIIIRRIECFLFNICEHERALNTFSLPLYTPLKCFNVFYNWSPLSAFTYQPVSTTRPFSLSSWFKLENQHLLSRYLLSHLRTTSVISASQSTPIYSIHHTNSVIVLRKPTFKYNHMDELSYIRSHTFIILDL